MGERRVRNAEVGSSSLLPSTSSFSPQMFRSAHVLPIRGGRFQGADRARVRAPCDTLSRLIHRDRNLASALPTESCSSLSMLTERRDHTSMLNPAASASASRRVTKARSRVGINFEIHRELADGRQLLAWARATGRNRGPQKKAASQRFFNCLMVVDCPRGSVPD